MVLVADVAGLGARPLRPRASGAGLPFGTMNDAFASAIKEIKPTYRNLVKSEPFRVDKPPSSVTGAGKKHPVTGVYILYEGPDRPLYVGRTRRTCAAA